MKFKYAPDSTPSDPRLIFIQLGLPKEIDIAFAAMSQAHRSSAEKADVLLSTLWISKRRKAEVAGQLSAISMLANARNQQTAADFRAEQADRVASAILDLASTGDMQGAEVDESLLSELGSQLFRGRIALTGTDAPN